MKPETFCLQDLFWIKRLQLFLVCFWCSWYRWLVLRWPRRPLIRLRNASLIGCFVSALRLIGFSRIRLFVSHPGLHQSLTDDLLHVLLDWKQNEMIVIISSVSSCLVRIQSLTWRFCWTIKNRNNQLFTLYNFTWPLKIRNWKNVTFLFGQNKNVFYILRFGIGSKTWSGKCAALILSFIGRVYVTWKLFCLQNNTFILGVKACRCS